MSRHLRLESAAGVARLLIDRQAKRNAFDQSMWESFPGLVARAMADDAVRVLVVAAAAPGAFCAGADIGEFAAQSGGADWRRRNQAAIRATQVTLARAPKPTIAAIGGDCIGGGCGIALACDIRLSAPHARFGITPARLGLVYPLHDTKLLVDLIGPAQAKRLLYTGVLIDAAEAHRIGLIEVLAGDLDAAVAAETEALLGASAATQAATKRIVARIAAGAYDDDAASAGEFDAAFAGADFAEGAAAFLAKRSPRFAAP